MNCTWDIPLSQFICLTHINDHCSSLLLRSRLLRCDLCNGWFPKKIAKHDLPFLPYRFLLRSFMFVQA